MLQDLRTNQQNIRTTISAHLGNTPLNFTCTLIEPDCTATTVHNIDRAGIKSNIVDSVMDLSLLTPLQTCHTFYILQVDILLSDKCQHLNIFIFFSLFHHIST